MKIKMIIASAFAALLVLGIGQGAFVFGKKKEVKFTVRIENISPAAGLKAEDGTNYPFAVSPGLYVVTSKKMDFFKSGKAASAGLERQAEDGNPEVLAKSLLTKIGSSYMGVFNTPVGAEGPAPILPGGVYEFTFSASEGMKLNLIAMYGQSNDLFYAPSAAIDLFSKGEALSGDITDRFILWDAGTEVNQAPGIGNEQAPRQGGPNTGTAENGRVGSVMDGFKYPLTQDVLKITITAE